MAARLILASTSPYRRELLQRLDIAFDAIAPQVDEQRLAGEAADALALRLAAAKAQAVATQHPQAIVIGSDQTALCGERLLGKPISMDNAREQLAWQSGREAVFHTAVAVVWGGTVQARCIDTRVRFRRLSAAEIDRYLRVDQPLDCAGSAKIERLGIALVDVVESTDPTALIGLPLIATCALLRAAGLALP